MVAKSTVLTAPAQLSDLMQWECDRQFCCEERVIKNAGAGAVELIAPLGTPLIDSGTPGEMSIALNASVAAIDGILMQTEPMPSIAAGASTPVKYLVLVRGPAIIKKDGLPVNDVAATPWTMATLITALEAKNILVRNPPPKFTST